MSTYIYLFPHYHMLKLKLFNNYPEFSSLQGLGHKIMYIMKFYLYQHAIFNSKSWNWMYFKYYFRIPHNFEIRKDAHRQMMKVRVQILKSMDMRIRFTWKTRSAILLSFWNQETREKHTTTKPQKRNTIKP